MFIPFAFGIYLTLLAVVAWEDLKPLLAPMLGLSKSAPEGFQA